jgi:Flp pilus assembly protein TadD
MHPQKNLSKTLWSTLQKDETGLKVMNYIRFWGHLTLASLLLAGTLTGRIAYAQDATIAEDKPSSAQAQKLLPEVDAQAPADIGLDVPVEQVVGQDTAESMPGVAEDPNAVVPLGEPQDGTIQPDAVPVIVGETPVDNLPPESPDVFYDAESLVPEGELSRSSPRSIDPSVEPASRLIIVRKNAEPDSQQARLVAAERAMKLGRYSSALEIYNELYSKNKRDPNILMGRAISLQKLGLIDEAVLAYERVLEVLPNNVEARISMLGIISEQYPAIALQQLKDLREAYPDNVEVAAQMGITEARMGNYDSAIRYMGVAASMEPNNANHYYNLAIIADKAGLKADAVKYYELSLETDSIYGGGRSIPRDSVYTRLAQLR